MSWFKQSGSTSQTEFLVGEILGSSPQDKDSADRKGREGHWMEASFFPPEYVNVSTFSQRPQLLRIINVTKRSSGDGPLESLEISSYLHIVTGKAISIQGLTKEVQLTKAMFA